MDHTYCNKMWINCHVLPEIMILWTAILYGYVQGREHWTVNPLNPPWRWPGGLSELNTLISAAILYRRRHFVVINMASKLMLQFTTEGLDLSKKSDVTTEIFTEITKLITVSDITGGNSSQSAGHTELKYCAQMKNPRTFFRKPVSTYKTNSSNFLSQDKAKLKSLLMMLLWIWAIVCWRTY